MIDKSLDTMIGKSQDPAVRSFFARSYFHGGMRDVCHNIISGQRLTDKYNPIKDSLPTGHFNAKIKAIARSFIDLQKARHQADYEISYNYSQRDAKDQLKLAMESI